MGLLGNNRWLDPDLYAPRLESWTCDGCGDKSEPVDVRRNETPEGWRDVRVSALSGVRLCPKHDGLPWWEFYDQRAPEPHRGVGLDVWPAGSERAPKAA